MRDKDGVSKYKLDSSGKAIIGKAKKGVPLSDVWDIPYLNPKAKERVGYPTQKPIILLKRIIEIGSDEGDIVVDPMMGSGTTCIAAKVMQRNFIGGDRNPDAVAICQTRLENIVITSSALLEKGKEAYRGLPQWKLDMIATMNAHPVRRNSGIDALLDEHKDGLPIPVRIQNDGESIADALAALDRVSKRKGYSKRILVQTQDGTFSSNLFERTSEAIIIKDIKMVIRESLREDTPNTAYTPANRQARRVG